MNGKEKCRILKEIRRQIAEANDINLVIAECTHKGACRGTCPRCEAEVRFLEEQLDKRRHARKRVVLAGISAGMTMALSGCALLDTAASVVDAVRPTATPEPEEELILDGEVDIGPYWEVTTGETPEESFLLEGEPALEDWEAPEEPACVEATPVPGA